MAFLFYSIWLIKFSNSSLSRFGAVPCEGFIAGGAALDGITISSPGRSSKSLLVLAFGCGGAGR